MRVMVLAVAATVACSSLGAGPAGPLDEAAFRRAVAARGVDPAAVVYPFALTPEMHAWAAYKAGPHAAHGGLKQLRALQEALFVRADFPFASDEDDTLTAAEAFAALARLAEREGQLERATSYRQRTERLGREAATSGARP